MNTSTTVYSITIFILYFLFIGCNPTQKKNNRTYTYFGGEIVNPNTNYVVLFKDNGKKDTLLLDENNRFFYKMEDVKDGLYLFRHNPENQIVLLEKGDSILIRLNTLEFDESLVFTGDGAKKNNFLIDMYLQNEIEREQLRQYEFKKSPSAFKKKQDSLLKSKRKAYDKIDSKYALSGLAKKIMQSSFIFEYYVKHELYFRSRHNISGFDGTKDLPDSFFDYRHNINFNDDDLKRLYAYSRYLNFFFTNSSFADYNYEFSAPKGKVGNTVFKLDLVDSLVTNAFIKNNLLRRITANYLLESDDDVNSNTILNHYLTVSSNENSKKDLKELYGYITRLRPDNVLPEQDLITTNGDIVRLSSLFKKPITALYFWSMDRKDHFVKAHNKASYLNDLYPNTDFIAINIDDEQTKNWLKTIKRHRYNLGKEYEFKYPKCSSEELVIYDRNKVILVNSEGKIIDAKANLFSPKLERLLAK